MIKILEINYSDSIKKQIKMRHNKLYFKMKKLIIMKIKNSKSLVKDQAHKEFNQKIKNQVIMKFHNCQ